MKIEEQVLNIEQMKHLQELGVDTSDASMAYYNTSRDNQSDKWILGIANIKVASVMLSNGITEMEPAYTTGDLIEKLPKHFYMEESPINMCAINGSRAFQAGYIKVPKVYKRDGNIKNTLYKLLCWVAENHKELLEAKKLLRK